MGSGVPPRIGRRLRLPCYRREVSLYAARENGVFFTARLGEKLELLGENAMGEQILASPVPIDGRLLIRSSGCLFCVN